MRVGVNLLVLTDQPPGGTGYHAVSLFEALIAAESSGLTSATITGFAEEAALRHFSEEARSRLVILPPSRGWRRVANELVRLPFAANRAGIDAMVNPAFFGAPWGGRRRALIIHDLYFRSVPRLVPWRRRMLLKTVVPLLGLRSEVIFSVSRATKAEVCRFYPRLGAKVRVLHNGLRPLLPANGRSFRRPIDKPYLLMVGHLTANKSPDVAIRAVRALERMGRDLTLVHIGDDGGRLGALAAEAGVSGSVLALGRQPDDLLAAHYAHCEALLIPSIREGFGLPLIEAQAHGAPVIASTCDALVEVGGDSALYFPIGSVERCVEAILTVLDDPAKREELIERGRANAALFRWDRTAEKLLDALGATPPSQSQRANRLISDA